jgi:hypothetical protein
LAARKAAGRRSAAPPERPKRYIDKTEKVDTHPVKLVLIPGREKVPALGRLIFDRQRAGMKAPRPANLQSGNKVAPNRITLMRKVAS